MARVIDSKLIRIFQLLEKGEQMNLFNYIRFLTRLRANKTGSNPQKKFTALKLSTKGFKFNREEANAR